MKNWSVVFDYTQRGPHNFRSTTPELGHRQGRTYGPFLSFLLATFFTKAVAKYAASSLLPITHQPWFSNKPVNYLSFNQIQQPEQIWKPASPYLHGLTAFAAESHHDHYSPPDPIHDDHTTGGMRQSPPIIDSYSGKYNGADATIESPDIFDQIPSQSQYNYIRQPAPNRWDYSPRRTYPPRREFGNRFPNSQRKRNPPNRYRTTTPPYYDFYDNYDDLATRQKPHRTRRPPIKRRPAPENYDYLYDSSEYDDEYDDYFETTTKFHERTTTKPYRKRKKTTKKPKTRKRTDNSEEDNLSDGSVEELENSEETSKEKPKQRQQATTTTTEATTTTESTESTTTEASTTTTTNTTTTTAAQNVTQPYGYGQGGHYDHVSFTYGPPVVHQGPSPPYEVHHNGYGPSNGNERISITQTPSFPIFYHNFPYANLFPQELTKNAIVQKVHDIVGYEHDFVHRK